MFFLYTWKRLILKKRFFFTWHLLLTFHNSIDFYLTTTSTNVSLMTFIVTKVSLRTVNVSFVFFYNRFVSWSESFLVDSRKKVVKIWEQELDISNKIISLTFIFSIHSFHPLLHKLVHLFGCLQVLYIDISHFFLLFPFTIRPVSKNHLIYIFHFPPYPLNSCPIYNWLSNIL